MDTEKKMTAMKPKLTVGILCIAGQLLIAGAFAQAVHHLKPAPIQSVVIRDSFWEPKAMEDGCRRSLSLELNEFGIMWSRLSLF